MEVDETYVGGEERNKHGGKRLKAGRGSVIAGTNSATLEEFVCENIKTGAPWVTSGSPKI